MSSAKYAKYDQEFARQVCWFNSISKLKMIVRRLLVSVFFLQLIDEALELRQKNRQRNVLPEPPAIVPAKHLALYTCVFTKYIASSLYSSQGLM